MIGGGLCLSSVRAANILAGPVYNPATTHSYFLLTSSGWTEAEAAAVNMGGHLVTVNDAAENDWLLSTFSNFGGQPRALWTGLTDAQQEGVFTWSSGEPVSYTHWEMGQPDDGSVFYPHEDYVLIWPSPGPRNPGYWNDYINTNTFPDLSIQVFGVVEITPNNWTNPVSAKWESPFWSLGTPPASGQVVNIMNNGYKAVNIDGATVSGFASSLTVGSLEVGAPANGLSTLLLNYAGLSTPLKVLNSCLIQTNGTLLNLSSSFEVDGANGGTLTIDGGTFTQQGGLTVVTPPVQVLNGTLNATNATMNLGPLHVGTGYPQSGAVNQSGGTILSSAITLDEGTYSLLNNGTLYALNGISLVNAARFVQTSGTNYGDVQLAPGSSSSYLMTGGLLHGTNIYAVTFGTFNQNGGTVEVQNLSAQGSTPYQYFPCYVLATGKLHCATMSIGGNNGMFRQVGGTLFLPNGLNLLNASGHGAFELHGGNASMPSLVVSNGGDYVQYGGTNQVAGDITVYSRGLSIYGGRLSSVNTGIAEGGLIYQDRGYQGMATNEISGVLSILGSYALVEGGLSVNGIYLRGNLTISFLDYQGVPTPAVLNNTGLINFGGALYVSSSQSSMGQLGLSANGTISLDTHPLTLRFADSHALNWDLSSTLTIEGWNGSYSGNGSHQLYFGSSAAGLTSQQLARIKFSISGGLYSARILATGEVVPEILAASRSGKMLTLTWGPGWTLQSSTNAAGPYQDVPGATSPRTISMDKSREFFRLRQ
jgi:hypothetical protein